MRNRLFNLLLLVPTLVALVACSDDVMAPQLDADDDVVSVPGPSFQLETTSGMTALRWTKPLKVDETQSKGISQKGGEVGASPGIKLLIPQNALDEVTDITVVSRAGEDVAFEFGPHGLEFNRAVTVQIHLDALQNRLDILQSAKMAFYNGTGGSDDSRIKLGSITAIYYANQNGDVVQVLQTFDVFVVEGKYLEFETDHFSGYALAA